MFNFTPSKTPVQAIWGTIKLIITISSFFVFGWKVGLVMVLLSIDLK